MLKNNKLKAIISSIVILLPALFGTIFWDKLPEQLSTHWGADGKVDGIGGTAIAVFALPLILLVLHWVCILITLKSPDFKEQGSKAINIMFWIIPAISLFANAIIYIVALQPDFNPTIYLPIFLGLCFAVMGNYMPKIKQNSMMGFKIKWTLENEENWNATHRFGGKLQVVSGLVIMLTALLPTTAMIIVSMSVLFLSVIGIYVYSYLYHKKQLKKGTYTVSATKILSLKKPAGIISIILVVAILIFCCFITFKGDVTVDYGNNNLTVDCDFWNELTVEYDAIDSIEYRENIDRGVRTGGLNSAVLMAGMFRNEEFGNYTLYSYTKCDSAVVINADGKILVINGENTKATKDLYNKISEYTKK